MNGLKITFINPKSNPYAVNFAHCMDLTWAKWGHIPLALVTLAALTPGDIPVEVIDENIEPVPDCIASDIVALSATVMQKQRAFELAEQYRFQGRHVVIGGSIAHYFPEECKRAADTVFIGEAEITWPAFLADFIAGNNRQVYEQKDWVDIALSPVPRFELLNAKAYTGASIQATRGCPYRCSFCDIPIKYGNAPRSKSVFRVIKELKLLVALGYDSVFFADDNFIGNREYAKTLLTELIGLNAGINNKVYYYTQAPLNVANDEELLSLLHRASFKRLFIGIETFNRQSHITLNKKPNLEVDSITASIAKIQSYGINVWAGILFGLEEDNSETFDHMLRFLDETNITPLQIGLLQAVPDTPLYQEMKKLDRLNVMPTIFGYAAVKDKEAKSLSNIIHKRLSDAEAVHLLKEFLRKAYSPQTHATRLINSYKRDAVTAKYLLPALNMRNVQVLVKTVIYYLFNSNVEKRKMFFMLVRAIIKKEITRIDELIFDLVIYKHLHTYYCTSEK